MRVAAYARYSSDKQSEASIEDQLRLCTEWASRHGHQIVQTYTDYAISGATLLRAGMQAMLRDAQEGRFDIILAEAMDRLSRDQEDIAGVYKRMVFHNVQIVTLSEGVVSDIHIGLNGTMNAIFLKNLSDKTRRGQRGRVEKGKFASGLCYGYDLVKRIGPDGEYVKGERAINEEQAAIVRRIFKEMIRGDSPRSIADRLNTDGIPGPGGGEWGWSTILGNRKRGTGIINNELYIGTMIWNRQKFLKDPVTRKRIARLNPESEWIRADLPHLKIIDQETWDAMKAVQGAYVPNTPLHAHNRPKHLLAGIARCGCCGGGFTLVASGRLGCATRKNKGKHQCANTMTIKVSDLEAKVLAALETHLMDDDLCAVFCKEYTRQMNELRAKHNSSLAGYRAEYAKLERERQQIIKAIADGIDATLIRDRANAIQRRRVELEALLAEVKEEPVVFHPNMSARYRTAIRELMVTFNKEEARQEARGTIRTLIDKVVCTPVWQEQRLAVDLVGDLAGILAIASNRDRKAVEADLLKIQPVQTGDDDEDKQNSAVPQNVEALVAGAGFEPATFRL